MNRQLKVFLVPYNRFASMARGETPIINLPSDAQILSHHNLESIPRQTGVAVLVHSSSFEHAAPGIPLPVVNAVFRREAECA